VAVGTGYDGRRRDQRGAVVDDDYVTVISPRNNVSTLAAPLWSRRQSSSHHAD
jgi:hypothetical protein